MKNKKIGVENFRVFKDYTEFELRPITLLTGPNNSGKSSLTKLLLLLQAGLYDLNFEEGQHNLATFENSLNWKTDHDILSISFANTLPFLGDEYKTTLQYKKAELKSIIISSKEDSLFELIYSKDVYSDEVTESIGNIQKVSLNIEHLIEMIYSKDIKVHSIVEKPEGENVFRQYEIFHSLANSKFSKVKKSNDAIMFSNLKSNIQKNIKHPYDNQAIIEYRNFTLFKEIDTLEKDYLLYEIEFLKDYPIPINKFDLRRNQKEVFDKMLFSFNLGSLFEFDNPKAILNSILGDMKTRAKQLIFKRVKEFYNTDQFIIKEKPLAKLIFDEKIFGPTLDDFRHSISKNPFEDGINFSKSVFDLFTNISLNIQDYSPSVHYISPQRGNQKRILMNNSENDIDKIIVEYSKLRDQKLEFLEKVFHALGIEGKLNIDRHENYISVVSLIKEDKKVTLADLGYGYSQIIPIILKIIIVMDSNYGEQTLIIEEPEANLHPNLQSKLANIFTLSQKYFPKLNFIIETHSEYLIRKLQYLTAKTELKTDQSVIYYFNADKYVSREEPKVKMIEITSTGNLTDTFGPGFYDEATRLKFDLMTINKEQNN